MEVVIYIPDEIYDIVCECEKNSQRFCMDVTGGKPLPKGHGRLIDADTFERNVQNEWKNNEISNSEWIQLREWIKDEPTIIEAYEDEE